LTYRFVTNLAAGGRVKLYYLRSGIVAGSNHQMHLLPYAVVSIPEWEQLQADAPYSIYKSEFRIIREYAHHLTLEWC
jgi:hypothetical protein